MERGAIGRLEQGVGRLLHAIVREAIVHPHGVGQTFDLELHQLVAIAERHHEPGAER